MRGFIKLLKVFVDTMEPVILAHSKRVKESEKCDCVELIDMIRYLLDDAKPAPVYKDLLDRAIFFLDAIEDLKIPCEDKPRLKKLRTMIEKMDFPRPEADSKDFIGLVIGDLAICCKNEYEVWLYWIKSGKKCYHDNDKVGGGLSTFQHWADVEEWG